MLGDEIIIAEMRVGGADAINLRKLAGAERFLLVEAPDALQQTLAAEDFVQAGDAAGETVRGVEEGGIAVGYFIRELRHSGETGSRWHFVSSSTAFCVQTDQ